MSHFGNWDAILGVVEKECTSDRPPIYNSFLDRGPSHVAEFQTHFISYY